LTAFALVSLLAACTTTGPSSNDGAAPATPVSGNSAVVALADTAKQQLDQDQAPSAVASLERALRLEPKNPRLWHELAQVRFKQGEYQQAESLATRSNSWAGPDKTLRAANWRLIGEARLRLGDNAGAQTANAKAEDLRR
jgi:Tfp pilus assembly protein PilF